MTQIHEFKLLQDICASKPYLNPKTLQEVLIAFLEARVQCSTHCGKEMR